MRLSALPSLASLGSFIFYKKRSETRFPSLTPFFIGVILNFLLGRRTLPRELPLKELPLKLSKQH